eukprot:890270-Pelagomonas_calceolata.AAC.1
MSDSAKGGKVHLLAVAKQRVDSQAAATKSKEEEGEEAGDGEGWSSDDEDYEDKEKAGLEALVSYSELR